MFKKTNKPEKKEKEPESSESSSSEDETDEVVGNMKPPINVKPIRTINVAATNRQTSIDENDVNHELHGAAAASATNYNVPIVINSEVDPNSEAFSKSVHMEIDKRLVELLQLPFEDLVMMPLPLGLTFCTRIVRKNNGIFNSLYPSYYMYIDMYKGFTEQKLLLIAKRKRKSRKISYAISVEKSNSLDNLVGKLKSNVIGTAFNIYDSGTHPKRSEQNRRIQLGYIEYGANPMGFKGPREMMMIIPTVDPSTGQRKELKPKVNEQSIRKKVLRRDLSNLTKLENKKPTWNEESRSFQLDFRQRVTHVSVKNFQLAYSDNPITVLLQSGRVGDNEFTCDFTHPFSILQAFGVAISSITSKVGCS